MPEQQGNGNIGVRSTALNPFLDYSTLRARAVVASNRSVRTTTDLDTFFAPYSVSLGRPDDVFLEEYPTVPPVKAKKKAKTLKEIEDDAFMTRVNTKINNGESLDKLEYRRFMRILKKNKHIDRSLRQTLHKLADDGAKTMASSSVDDLIPIN